MPHYYMHLHDGLEFIEDLEGTDFVDDAAASKDARAAALEMLAELMRRGEIVNGQRIEIFDDGGNLVDTVRFSEQFKTLKPPPVV